MRAQGRCSWLNWKAANSCGAPEGSFVSLLLQEKVADRAAARPAAMMRRATALTSCKLHAKLNEN
jgi:hypothetical protein